MIELGQEQTDSGEQTDIENLERHFPPEESATLIATLRMLGAVKIHADFSGSGDDGNINEASVLSLNNTAVELDNHFLEITETYRPWGQPPQTKKEKRPLKEIVNRLCDELLEKTGHDWYNDDGGQGTIDIDLRTGHIELDVGINRTETTDYTYEYWL